MSVNERRIDMPETGATMDGNPGDAAGPLDADGLLPSSQLPPLAIGEIHVVASQAAMLALDAQRGDVAKRTDTGVSYWLSTDDPTTLANWVSVSALTIAGISGLEAALDAKPGISGTPTTGQVAKWLDATTLVGAALANSDLPSAISRSTLTASGLVTGANLRLTATGPGVLQQASSGAQITVGAVAQSDVSGLVSDLAAKAGLSGTPVAGEVGVFASSSALGGVGRYHALSYTNPGGFSSGTKIVTTIPSAATGKFVFIIHGTQDSGANQISGILTVRIAGSAISGTPALTTMGSAAFSSTTVSIESGFLCITIATTTQFHLWVEVFTRVTGSYYTGWSVTDAAAVGGTAATRLNPMAAASCSTLDHSGAVTMSGSPASAGASVRNRHGNGGSTSVFENLPTGGEMTVTVNGTAVFTAKSGEIAHGAPMTLTGSPASAGSTIRQIHGNSGTTDLYSNVPTGGTFGWSVNSSTLLTLNTSVLNFTGVPITYGGSPINPAGTARYISGEGGTSDWAHNVPTGGTHRWKANGTDVASLNTTRFLSGVDLQFAGGNKSLRTSTNDGSDSDSLSITGAGAVGSHRGGRAGFYGNEHATAPGCVDIAAGNVSGGNVRIYSGNDVLRLSFNSDGTATVDPTWGASLGAAIGACPTGLVTQWGTGTPPTGWLLADGSAVSRSTYAALFALIGTTFGAGNGSTTFNLPDFRGRVPMGAGTGTGLTARTLAGTVGAETITLSTPAGSDFEMSVNAANKYTINPSTNNTIQPSLVVNFIIKT